MSGQQGPASEAGAGSRQPLFRSLRVRLLAATIAGLAVALLLAGFALGSLFREHVLQQFRSGLTQQLDQLTAQLDFSATGEPLINTQLLYDPRWQRPYSGLYWQLDQLSADGNRRKGVLRSRSLWDTSLQLHNDALAGPAVHVHETTGPMNSKLLTLARTVRAPDGGDVSWRLIVAADMQQTSEAVRRFTAVLAASLLVLLGLLVIAAWAQVSVGLKPLSALQRSLRDLQSARTARLQGRFPSEVQPLVDDFNRVLDQNREVVERARTQAGNLAHALKTPLTVLENAAAAELASNDGALPRLVQEQVLAARRHVDWHLARARASATQRLPGQRTDVANVVAGLVRVMARMHADIRIETHLPEPPLYFAGEEQDLHEMLGNLLDNACKWAHSSVQVCASLVADAQPPLLRLTVQDDGPGIDDAHYDAVQGRGVRLDESVPGTGLGLAITKELASLYGGSLNLRKADQGLEAIIVLPAIGRGE
jgi:signal transduction histidine kinase